MVNNINTKAICPVCNKKRTLQIDNIVLNKENSFVVYNKCPHCNSAFLASISKHKEKGFLVVETLTDLSYQEAVRVSTQPPLTANAFLDIYQQLYK